MKLGFVGFIYTPPQDITDPLEGIKWQIKRVSELGGSVFHTALTPFPEGEASDHALKEYIDSMGVELELGTGSVFELTGPKAKEAREQLAKDIAKAKFFGSKIIRTGYGRLVAKTTRFNKEFPLKEHMKFVVDNLKEAAKIFEDAGIYFALENHCDFKGKEFAEMFSEVNSKHVGCALDTANGYTVYCDPDEDVEYLAEFAVTTHIKDMLVDDYKSDTGLIPFQARGCAVGDGSVNIPRAIELLEQRSPFANGLHLIIEQGCMNYDGITDRPAHSKACVEKGMKYLQKLLGRA
jgi:sugar phosphate isomerase/epimerase